MEIAFGLVIFCIFGGCMSFLNNFLVRGRRRIIPFGAMIMGIFLAVSGVIGLALPAQAAELPGAIKSVTVTPENPQRYDEITVSAEWAVPDSAKGGDTFTLQLPVELDSLVSSFDVRNSKGELIATATVSGGVVTFTVTDFVNTHKNVSGTATFATRLNRDLEPDKPYVLKFGTEFEVTITPKDGPPVDRTSSHKYGFWVDANGQPSTTPTDRIRWTVESPKGPFTEVSFDDTVGDGMELDCSSVKMNFSQSFLANEEVQAWGPDLVRDSDFTVTGCLSQSLAVTGPEVPEGQVVRLVYDTKVTDASASSYRNTALVTLNGVTKGVVTTEFRRGTASGNGEGDENIQTTTPTTVPPTTVPPTTVPPTTEPPTTVPPVTTTPVTTGDPETSSSSAPATPVPAEKLANTGANGLLVTALAGGLALVAGAGLLLLRRRTH